MDGMVMLRRGAGDGPAWAWCTAGAAAGFREADCKSSAKSSLTDEVAATQLLHALQQLLRQPQAER